AISFYSRLNHVGSSVYDQYTYSSVIKAYVETKRILVVVEAEDVVTTDDVTFVSALMATSQLHNIQFEGMESYLIDMYAKSNIIREEQAIFQWNAMISGNTQNGLIEQSFVVFMEMLEQNMKPNVVTLASILPSSSQSGSIAIGKQLHCLAIRNLFENNVYVVSALVDMYSKSGIFDYAESVF
ncbi:hypothetical protein MTR67_048144, partial [Solanum verrucosum]